MPQLGLVLSHPPSGYNFRQTVIMSGPISDLIPSSPVFEMDSLGFLTITNSLQLTDPTLGISSKAGV